jgi:hypothetical protein
MTTQDSSKSVDTLMTDQRNYVCQHLNTIFDESSKKLQEMLVEKMNNVIKSEAVTNTITSTIQAQLNSKIESSMKDTLERMISESKFDEMISNNVSAIFDTSIKDFILLSMQKTSDDVTRTICHDAAVKNTSGGKRGYKRRTLAKKTKRSRKTQKRFMAFNN